jgi:acyl carrier protein
MIPTEFVALPALPLTANGKLDRAALPDPSPDTLLHADAVSRLPRSPLESNLADLLSEVLGNGPIGIDDNFFLLGGHSLLGTRVVVRLREMFGVDITLLHLFEAPTVAKLGVRIEALLIEKLEQMSDEEAARSLVS